MNYLNVSIKIGMNWFNNSVSMYYAWNTDTNVLQQSIEFYQ